MNKYILPVFLIIIFFSCKKEDNGILHPTENIENEIIETVMRDVIVTTPIGSGLLSDNLFVSSLLTEDAMVKNDTSRVSLINEENAEIVFASDAEGNILLMNFDIVIV